jgi:hypothetical protein
MMKGNVFKIFLWLLALSISFLPGCKTVVDKFEFDTEIDVTLKNDMNVLRPNADVGIYNDYNKFKADIDNDTIKDGNAIQVTVTDSVGKAIFKNLDPGVSYWISSFYSDPLRIKGTNIKFNNIDINNELAFNLRKGSVTYITIKMKPSSGIITFLVPTSEQKRLPLAIKFNNKQEGDITNTFDATLIPNPDTLLSNTLHVNAKKGTGYYIINSNGCSWNNTVQVIGGQQTFVKLEPCETGTLSFYSDITDSTEYPITIELNNYDILPILNKNNPQGVSLDCAAPNLYSIERGKGSVTYKALTAKKKCVWVGQADVLTNQCTIVKLPKCK